LQKKNKEIKHAWFILGGVWYEVKKIVVNYYRLIIIRAIFKGIKLDFNDVWCIKKMKAKQFILGGVFFFFFFDIIDILLDATYE